MALGPSFISGFRNISTLRKPTKPKSVGVSAWSGYYRAPSAPAATPFSPVGSSAASLGSVAAPPPKADPHDPQWANDVAKIEQQYTARKAELAANREDLGRQLSRSNETLNLQQPKDTLSAKENANKAGLFYSGALGKNLGEIESSYARRRSQLQEDYASSNAGIDRQLKDLEENYGPTGLLRNDALLAGAARGIQADQQYGTPGPTSTTAPVAAGPTKATASIGRPQKTVGGRRFYQRASDGKWIPF